MTGKELRKAIEAAEEERCGQKSRDVSRPTFRMNYLTKSQVAFGGDMVLF